MKHYVLGFLFTGDNKKVLLVEKQNPEWQKGRFNGIGGKIEEGETPQEAMDREAMEEIGVPYVWEHVITFVCPGGTVYVFTSFYKLPISNPYTGISYRQIEAEKLGVYEVSNLPDQVMANVRWIIPLCLASIQFPVLIHQKTLGVD